MATGPLTKERIIDQHVLTFDAEDKKNGSLYLGELAPGE